MKSRSRAGRGRSSWGRIAGYGGAVLLVAAAVAVLLYPLLGTGKDGAATAGDRAAGSPVTSPAATAPGRPATPEPTGGGTRPQQDRTGDPGQGAEQGGGGPPMPGHDGGTITYCPSTTAVYRPVPGGLEVVIRVSASGLVRAEVSRTGREALSKQDSVEGGRPHTFTFPGVGPETVRRVKVTTVSVGVAMQTCYARAAG